MLPLFDHSATLRAQDKSAGKPDALQTLRAISSGLARREYLSPARRGQNEYARTLWNILTAKYAENAEVKLFWRDANSMS